MNKRLLAVGTVATALSCFAAVTTSASAHPGEHGPGSSTTTPIKHLVVIFQENVSFDHYFGTYPNAANNSGETPFFARQGTPTVNGLNQALLTANPNLANPQRLSPAQALTCDMDHGYTDEQKAFDKGLMDQFVEHTSGRGCTDKSQVMDYYDGNTVTAMWNYAQRFAMSDNSFDTEFGPSTPGALNLVSGQTHGVYSVQPGHGQTKTATPDSYTVADPNIDGIGTVIGDPDPAYDDCSGTKYARAAMTGTNIGDLLSAKGVTWGWFQGGFAPTVSANDNGGIAVCGSTHTNIGGATVTDYSPHHNPFEYYQSTSNPHHLPPSSVPAIGTDADQAKHNYDLTNFWQAVKAGNMPAVSFLKAASYQDGHAGYSDPIDEQHFLVDTLNKLQQSKDWASTAVVISYDDSDGWYDHVMPPIVNQSATSHDALTGDGLCAPSADSVKALGGYSDRCGYGARLPLLVLSPYSKTNFVDNNLTDQTSILRFVEDNWQTGQIGDGSFDQLAGSLNGMFDFSSRPNTDPLLLNADGSVNKDHGNGDDNGKGGDHGWWPFW